MESDSDILADEVITARMIIRTFVKRLVHLRQKEKRKEQLQQRMILRGKPASQFNQSKQINTVFCASLATKL